MFNFLKEKIKKKIKVNEYRLNIQTDITAYELYKLQTPRIHKSYSELNTWYDNLSDLTKRHIVKHEIEVDEDNVFYKGNL